MVLISVDIPLMLKERKEKLGVPYGTLILRGVQTMEGKDVKVMEQLAKDNERLIRKLQDLAIRVYKLENEVEEDV